MLKACKECNLLTERSECPLCKGSLSKDWQGYLIILDHRRSTIAQRMNIQRISRFDIFLYQPVQNFLVLDVREAPVVFLTRQLFVVRLQ